MKKPVFIPFFDSTRQHKKISGRINKALQNVLSSGWYILGQEVKNFEKDFAGYLGARHAVAVNSGTDALKIALRAIGIKEGDEVITVSNTAVPTVSAIRETGAKLALIDVDRYLTLDQAKIENKITGKTKAIVAVHLYGGACDMTEIMRIAKKHGLKVVEDCAQAAGATYRGKKLGTWGEAGCFSFYPTKNLGALGDGGIIVTSKTKLAEKCRALRMYGMEKSYHSEREGWNSRLDEIQAAVLRVKLPYLDKWNERRRKIAEMYASGVKNPLINLPPIRPKSEHIFHLFVIRTAHRDKLLDYLKRKGVGTGIHYPFPIHLQDGYRFLKYKKGSLPVTEQASREIISLPIFPELKKSEIRHIIKALNEFHPK